MPNIWIGWTSWGRLGRMHDALVTGDPDVKLEFHHINYVSKDVDGLHDFYVNILKMDSIAPQQFPRTDATSDSGYDGKIKFATEGSMQMHLAERDLDVAAKNGRHINPVERGHIAFRTDDIEGFKRHLRVRTMSTPRRREHATRRWAARGGGWR